MHRETNSARVLWKQRVEKQGLLYHTHQIRGKDVPYWNETAHYVFSADEVDQIEEATNTVYQLCLQAIDRIVRQGWVSTRLHLPPAAAGYIVRSWQEQELSLYGRFDFAYNPSLDEHPKLLEFNGDTPTGLIEASVIQWFWLQDHFRDRFDQFNSIDEALVVRFRQFRNDPLIHFAVISEALEDYQTVVYLADAAQRAEKQTNLLHISSVGWSPESHEFRDADENRINCLFKLYPWEDLLTEEFGAYIPTTRMRWIEPAWRIMIANKAILPILWEMFPDHPNLLPAYDEPSSLGDSYCKKAVFSREGQNMTMRVAGMDTTTGGEYAAGPFIYQKLHPLPQYDGFYPVVGSWIIDDSAHGMGIRESTSMIIDNHSQFVPHYFLPRT